MGDTVEAGFGDKTEIFTITGLTNGSSMGGTNTCILADDFKRLNPDFKPQSLYIYLNEGTETAAFIEKLEDKFDKETVLSFSDFDKLMAEGMSSYQSIVAAMGLAMLVITLMVVALVLYFMISSSVIRRKRELGIQKAIGYTTFQLMNQLSLTFMLPVVFGSATGSLLGAFCTNPLMSVAMKGAGVMRASFIVDPLWIACFGVGVVVFPTFFPCLPPGASAKFQLTHWLRNNSAGRIIFTKSNRGRLYSRPRLFSFFRRFFFILLAPPCHGVQNRLQAVSGVGQRIFHPRRYLGVYLPENKPLFLHIPQLGGQNLLADASYRFFSSPNRFVPGSRSRRINTFHLSPIMESVISTGQAGNTGRSIKVPQIS